MKWLIVALCLLVAAVASAEVGIVPARICGQVSPGPGAVWHPVCKGPQVDVEWRYTDGYAYVAAPREVCVTATHDEVPGASMCTSASSFVTTHAALADGSHVVGVEAPGIPSFPQPYTQDATPGPVLGAQWLWSCPRDQGTRLGFTDQTRACERVWYPGVGNGALAKPSPPRPALKRLSVRPTEREMFVEHPIPLSGLYQPPPAFFRTKDGHPVVRALSNHYTSHFMEAAAMADTLPRLDGPRGIGFVTNYSTYNIHPTTGDIWFVENVNHGRLGKITRTGTVTTIAGYRTKGDVLPFLPFQIGNNAANTGTPWTEQLELVGQWEGTPGFHIPMDFVFDRADPTIVYVADTGNQCVRRVDTITTKITTFAGRCGRESTGTAGFVDGYQARFDWPFSITQVSTKLLYVADRGNDAIRRIHPDGKVETPVGLGYRPPPVSYAQGCMALRTHSRSGSFTEASIYHPMVVRATSTDDLLVLEDIVGLVRKIDRARGQVSTLLDITGQCVNYQSWYWLDVDRRGLFGPVDDFFVVQDVGGAAYGVQTNEYFWRFDKHGQQRQRLVGSYGGSTCNLETSAYESCGPHYPWTVAVGPGMLCTNGWGQTGSLCLRRKLASDPQDDLYGTAVHYGLQYLQREPRTHHGWYLDGRLGLPTPDTADDLPSFTFTPPQVERINAYLKRHKP